MKLSSYKPSTISEITFYTDGFRAISILLYSNKKKKKTGETPR